MAFSLSPSCNFYNINQQRCLTYWSWHKMAAISQTTFFKFVFLNENIGILIKISPKFVPKGVINNIPALVQIVALHWPGNKPLSEPKMVSLLTHICITWPQWVNCVGKFSPMTQRANTFQANVFLGTFPLLRPALLSDHQIGIHLVFDLTKLQTRIFRII